MGQDVQEVLRPEPGWWPEGWTERADCREPLRTERGAREGHLGQSRERDATGEYGQGDGCIIIIAVSRSLV